MLRECGDVLDIQSNGSTRVVTPLEFLQHALPKLGHHKRLLKRDDPLYSSNSGVSLPRSGFVQQALSQLGAFCSPMKLAVWRFTNASGTA
jgi:hypothetical protein